MIKQLQKKFIIIAISSITIVISTLILIVTVTGYLNITNTADNTIETIINNGGTMQQQPDRGPKRDTFLFYFIVDVDENNKITTMHIDTGIFKADYIELESYYTNVDLNSTRGYVGDFRYYVYDNQEGKSIIFLDNTRELESWRNTLQYSVIFSIIGLFACLLLIVVFSKKAIKPIAEIYEKQKQFITDASHELKTPLTIINSSADIIEMNDSETKWTKNIKTQVTKLSDLINNLITLSKMNEDTMENHMIEFNVSNSASTIIDSYTDIANKKNITVNSNIQSNTLITASIEDINKLLNILFDNAFKYAKSYVNFELKKEGKKVHIKISNDADNLEKKSYNELLERFYRLDSSRNSETGGYGLGLSIANVIVDNHKGSINISSSDAKQIDFTITI